jgi:uncharacterized protein
MNQHEKINYVELPSRDLPATKNFYSHVFGWGFVDYGTEYIAITNGGLDGGFYFSHTSSLTSLGATLVVIYSKNLAHTQEKIEQFGGNIIRPTYNFPGGARFHFLDSTGNELAVWSETAH